MVQRTLIHFLLLNFMLTDETFHLVNFMLNEDIDPEEYYLVLNNENSTLNGKNLTEDNSVVSISNGENIVHYEKEYANIPNYGEAKNESEKHSNEECNQEKLITIKKGGKYIVSGNLKGQLSIKIKETENITLVLKGVNIYCSVAPGVIFYKAYEMDEINYEKESISINITKALKLSPDQAGVKIIIADDTENTISGSHVAKFYEYTKNNDGTITVITSPKKKKKAKYDGAFYSKVSLSIKGETKGNGILNIIGDNEGLDSEKHIIISGGNINIASQDDGINANNEGGSVILINGGNVKVNGGLGSGGGIDSNGYLIVQQGKVISAGSIKDNGINGQLGIVINGGTVIGVGAIQSWQNEKNETIEQPIIHLRFSSEVPKNRKLCIKDSSGTILISFNPLTSRFIPGTQVRAYIGAVISHPSLEWNNIYYLYLGNTKLYVKPSDERKSTVTPKYPDDLKPYTTELNLTSNVSTFDVFYVNTESSSSKSFGRFFDFSFINLFAFLIILF